MTTELEQTGIVVIGRNEGERLRRCLDSVVGGPSTVVYVDSGSSDGSVTMARAKGVELVDLDMTTPFTMARARNAGFRRLEQLAPEVELVQFVDGDCQVVLGWVQAAADALRERTDVGAVCGYRRERHVDASIYNRLCDMDWRGPVSEVGYCGGDVMMRAEAFREVQGYNPAMIAGEDPEICVRLRQAGWKVLRLDTEMTLHDAAMTRFAQWWRRMVRGGHAYAEGMVLHGRSPERYCVKKVISILAWAAFLPLVILALAWPTRGLSLLLLGLYAVLWLRVRRARLDRNDPVKEASLYAAFCVIGKFAELLGVALYLINLIRGRRTRIIEYKVVEPVDQGRAGSDGVDGNGDGLSRLKSASNTD